MTRTRRARGSLAAVAALLLAGCAGGSAPEFDPVDRQVVPVGVQLSLQLTATDPDGDALAFAFSSTIPELDARATITRSPSGAAIFRWTPLAADVGTWFIDFTASDGDNAATLTVELEVRSAVGGNGAPVFRQPLGTGTTLDLDTDADGCVDVPVVVEDQDSPAVTLTQDEPVIEGAELTVTGGLTAAWRWCPTRAQVDADDRYTLTLRADDGENPATVKNYLVVLRQSQQACPGAPPVITHVPADATTLASLVIDAQVSDDVGLKNAPLLYYALTPPGADPDLATMTQLTMLQLEGTLQAGVWAAEVPNPVAGMPAGTSRELYYVVVADDDDDPAGGCDHVTESPVFSMTVTGAAAGDAGLCEPCAVDAQCADGLCVRVGAANEPFCLQDCAGTCPSGYTCSASPVTSVDGASGRQCVPSAGSCTGSVACADDDWEDNDSRSQAAANPPLPANDVYALTSCPLATGGGDDEDFFELDIAADSRVTVEISGSTASDLDLSLQTATGTVLQSSTSLQSDETITRCLTPGLYYVRVYAFGAAANDYLLAYDRTAQACAGACVDDLLEDDDALAQANPTTYPVHVENDRTICGDDDWYAVELFTGERVIVDLTFAQATAAGDLDTHFHDALGVDLTPCSEAAPSTCTAAQGQSADANERFEYVVPSGCNEGCPYYLRVHGWAGATNTYDLRIEVQ
jgi:hypothetical protein